MKIKEFDNLKIGSFVYVKDGMGGQVSKINRTTKRISGIGIGNDIFWRNIHTRRPKNAISHGICGVCCEYHIVERMEFVGQK